MLSYFMVTKQSFLMITPNLGKVADDCVLFFQYRNIRKTIKDSLFLSSMNHVTYYSVVFATCQKQPKNNLDEPTNNPSDFRRDHVRFFRRDPSKPRTFLRPPSLPQLFPKKRLTPDKRMVWFATRGSTVQQP
jgi:hypothetical protein